MIDFTIIKFKSEDVAKKYEKDTSTLGVVLEKTNDVFTVLFFNVKTLEIMLYLTLLNLILSQPLMSCLET